MPIVLGIDSSTQSISGTVINTDTGEVLYDDSIPFSQFTKYEMPKGYKEGPDGEVHSNPRMWLDGLDALFQDMKNSGVPLDKIEAISGDGQQHGSVFVNNSFARTVGSVPTGNSLSHGLAYCFSRNTSPIWMDGSTAEECDEITEAIGSPAEVGRRSGSVATKRFTGPQIRRFSKTKPNQYAATTQIHLVSSFMGSVIAGRPIGIDPGDGAGMNLMNLAANDWDGDLLAATAPDLRDKLPNVVDARKVVGSVNPYFQMKYGLNPSCKAVMWTGDNPSSLVGMGAAGENRRIVSLGTSATIFASMDEAVTDPRGYGHAFGNPLGGYMSLICFKNSTPTEAQRNEALGISSWPDFAKALADTEPGNGNRIILPFFGNEITPPAKSQGIQPIGWDPAPTSEEKARGVLEGLFLNMKKHSAWIGEGAKEVWLTGGGAKDEVALVAANVFGQTVRRLENPGSASLGSAMRAAEAIGVPIAELERQFSSPDPDGDVAPQAEFAGTYRDLEEQFGKDLVAAYPDLAAS